MKNSKLRRQIAFEAARLMYDRQETEYYRAKQKAASRICKGWVKPADLPSNAEIRDAIQSFARLLEGDSRTENLQAMRLAALRMMRRLSAFRPRLIGSVLTGHIRQGSDIDLHVFSDSAEAITHLLDSDGLSYQVERKQVRKAGEEQVFTHIHVRSDFSFELTMYAPEQHSYVFKSSITGKAIERASIAQLEQFLAVEYPDLDIEAALSEVNDGVDCYRLFESLLLPLEDVKQHARYHPEGDVLYHSLQVFDHARDEMPYDEEFLTAALLHDVGKGIDPRDHVNAGIEALEGFITERTAWLIEHHMHCHLIIDGSLGARAHRRLRACEWYEELILLGECDRAGRQRGVEAPELDEALDYLRDLGGMFDPD
ncbi:HD domain-containing protein [Aeoliella sp. ICT_H6.2]|uniref:HD domain-containing protein n=1 Tax=Aeoliella straminimaris TaxID=2954799 RepID=A0A9X2JIX7_9BACT|nr:HD domain-containing protein [Aeoliella straminimaris]